MGFIKDIFRLVTTLVIFVSLSSCLSPGGDEGGTSTESPGIKGAIEAGIGKGSIQRVELIAGCVSLQFSDQDISYDITPPVDPDDSLIELPLKGHTSVGSFDKPKPFDISEVEFVRLTIGATCDGVEVAGVSMRYIEPLGTLSSAPSDDGTAPETNIKGKVDLTFSPQIYNIKSEIIKYPMVTLDLETLLDPNLHGTFVIENYLENKDDKDLVKE